jgi:hypothetical protein
VPGAVQFIYEKTPPDFTIMDWIRSIDDKDEHMGSKPLTYYKDANRLIAGQSALAVDTYLHQKMGYSPFESEVIQPIAKDAHYPEVNVKGDTLFPLDNWKTVPWSERLKFRLLLASVNLARKNKRMETEMKKIFRKSVRMTVL